MAALPPELLRHVFSFLLPPNEQPTPLVHVARTWHTLRLVCSAWAQVVADMPVAVEGCLPLPATLPWLQRHATALRLVPPPREGEVSQTHMLEWVWDRCGPLTLQQTGLAESMLQVSFLPLVQSSSSGSWLAAMAGWLAVSGLHTCLVKVRPIAPVPCWLQADATLTYDEFIKQLALAGGRCGMLSYRSSLFVPPGTAYRYSGDYEPLPMLQLADMQRLQVRCGQAVGWWQLGTRQSSSCD